MKISERQSTFKLEWEIIKDKLAHGVNGIEWLVMNYIPKEHKVSGITDWIRYLKLYGHLDFEKVFQDALRINSDDFYKKYEFNWWMAVSYTLTYLYLIKQSNYEVYFGFIKTLEKNGGVFRE